MTVHEGCEAVDSNGFTYVWCSCGYETNRCSDDDVAWSEWEDHRIASADKASKG